MTYPFGMSVRNAVLCAWLLGICGCVAPRPRTFVLGPPVDPAAQAAALPAAVDSRLEVRKVIVPEYLDNENILLRRGREVLLDTTARWREPLSQGMTDALVAGLTSRLPEDSITTGGSPEAADRSLAVKVDAFDVWPDGRCILTASWRVLDRNTHSVLISGYGTFVTAANGKSGDDALVGAVSRAIGQLTEKIAVGTIANEITDGGTYWNLSKYPHALPAE